MLQNPLESRAGRQAQRRTRRRKGSLNDAQALLWRALIRAGDLLDDPDPVRALRAVHAIAQGTGAYARLVEVGELQARLNALEARLEGHT